MQFSFLHISDLHFDSELVSMETFRKKVKDKIKKDNLKADCLIISGDLFNRGKLNREGFDRCDEFLRDIPGRGFTVVVPGNHDLDRSAQNTEDESYNVFLTRKQLVLRKGEEAFLRRQFSLNDDEKKILYKSAYEAFFTFSRQMDFKSFMQKDPALKAEWYEVQVVPKSFGDFPCTIKFVLLNTGLIAGQSVSGNEYRERKRRLKKELDEATVSGDYVKAAEVQVKLAKQQKRFEDDGELIIDEENYQEDGSGRLSLSKDGLSVLSDTSAEDTELTIFVGHHGYQFLSSETKRALKQAMENCKSGIYLCGHAHRARYERFKIGNNTTPKDIEQIQAGVMFKDEGGYTQYGFDHGVISVDNNNDIVCSITSYFLTESASSDLLWMSETIDIPLNGIGLPSRDEIKENVRSQDLDEDNKMRVTDPDLKNHTGPERAIPHTPRENPSSLNGPVSTGELRRHIFNKQPPADGEQNKKEQ